MTKTDEKGLFLEIAGGNEESFRELYHFYGRLLFPFLVGLTGREDMADEIIQEVFLRVWLYRDKLPEVQHPRAWLFQIASNQANTWLAKDLKAEMAEMRHQETPASTDTPADLLILNDIRRVIRKAVGDLPAQRRRIYLLHREQGIREKVREAGYYIPLVLLLLKKL
jgi:RNA polymerase sigma factor (sigma-70 family)